MKISDESSRELKCIVVRDKEQLIEYGKETDQLILEGVNQLIEYKQQLMQHNHAVDKLCEGVFQSANQTITNSTAHMYKWGSVLLGSFFAAMSASSLTSLWGAFYLCNVGLVIMCCLTAGYAGFTLTKYYNSKMQQFAELDEVFTQLIDRKKTKNIKDIETIDDIEDIKDIEDAKDVKDTNYLITTGMQDGISVSGASGVYHEVEVTSLAVDV